jgi:hypothetical protein
MARFMGYDLEHNLDGFVLVDQASQNESITGDDQAIFRGKDGKLYEFLNGFIRPLSDGPYTLRRENDFLVKNGKFIRKA